MADIFLKGNSNVLEVQDLKNTVTDLVDTQATVQVTLYDRQGNTVGGQSWPATMVHVADGLYRVTLNSALAINYNNRYEAHIEAIGKDGEIGLWETPIMCLKRTDW